MWLLVEKLNGKRSLRNLSKFMIIFGWGFQTIKNFGPAFKNLCNHCNNEQYWVLTRIMTWFTLFFIPIFPYEITYRLSCPVCKYGLTLNQKQVSEIKPLAELNQLLVEGQITQEEYQVRLNRLNDGPSEPIEAEIVETKALTENVSSLSYCASCGGKVTEELRFCGNCGTPTTTK